jgi:hypothetical protein
LKPAALRRVFNLRPPAADPTAGPCTGSTELRGAQQGELVARVRTQVYVRRKQGEATV